MKRSAGILLPLFCLPSPYGIGCMDKAAYDFVDFLAAAGQKYWQILPLGATGHGGSDDSPYQTISAFAGNPYFLSLPALVEEGVLTQEECEEALGDLPDGNIDYDALHQKRLPLLRKAYERSNISGNSEFLDFVWDNAWWLDDYATFAAVRSFFGEAAFSQWPEDIRKHWGFALDHYRRELYFDIEFHKYLQFQFFRQWKKLKDYANQKGISIIGDVPIYVSPDSADVWAHPELFRVDSNGCPTEVAGCPPDAFAEEGQMWGNPLYRWEQHRNTDYGWWRSRVYFAFRLYDVVRLDHFRGFDEYFVIPADSENALSGHWEKGPNMELFHCIRHHLGEKQFIAEDLGFMTDSVRELVKNSGFPNMKVLQFAFDVGDTYGKNPYLPHHHSENCVVYTGTHDNDTLLGWLSAMDAPQQKRLEEYFRREGREELRKAVMDAAMGSTAKLCIIPLQDHLKLDGSHRVNQPGTVGKNWRWRLNKNLLTESVAQEIYHLTCRFGRGE